MNLLIPRWLSDWPWGRVADPKGRNLVDPARCHMLVLKIKPCMSKYK
jgi:hypothetical protein